DCPRISADYIAEETRAMGPDWVAQEFECSFNAMQGLVYPHFEDAVITEWPNPAGRLVGGIDFGWRNPFAAVWGVLDREDVLWLHGERYRRQTPLHEHAAALRELKGVTWYADPAGATEIAELRAAGLTVRSGDNAIAAGIAAVSARLRTGRLKVFGCPNLVAEARLYRYPTASERALLGENPIDDNNHALAALRYLVSRIDARFLARLRRPGPIPEERRDAPPEDEGLWTALG